MTYESIKARNPGIKMFKPEEEAFSEYGRVLKEYDFSEMIAYMQKHTNIPQTGNVYVPSDAAMEAMRVSGRISSGFYGEMPLQIGYCNGKNSNLNALEYHKGSEINVAVTDLILLLGKIQDIRNNIYDTGNIKAFFIPSGCAVELYGTSLHFTPCKTTEAGFKAIVVLPKGTNLPLKSKPDESSGYLFAVNKWLIAHPSNTILLNKGAIAGMSGENTEIKFD